MQYAAIGIRCLVGLVFLASALSKLASTRAQTAFVMSMRDLRILPTGLVRWVASGVIIGELAVCVLLATPSASAVMMGFALTVVLLSVFTAGITIALRRGVRVPCRCFGASRTPLGRWHIGRNAVLVLITCVGALVTPGAADAQPAGVATAAAAGVALGALVTVLDDVRALFRPLAAPPGNTLGGR